LASIATIGAMISLLEVPVAYLSEERKWSRKNATLASALLIASLGSTATLSSSVLANFSIFNLDMFSFFDYMSSNVLMPLTGIAVAIFAGYKLGPKLVSDEISNKGTLANQRIIKAYLFVVRYVTPLAVGIVLLNALGIIKL
jgi:NSS family neurotransmitter:Na+ symporter